MICLDFKSSPISETLIIPLLAKAKESRRKDPIVEDAKALEVIQQLTFDTARFEGGEISDLGIISRTQVLDKEIRRLSNAGAGLVIINLGAGLDTRESRIADAGITWFDLDLPEVINLRRRFFEENERTRFISKSVLDDSWTEEIPVEDTENLVIVAEGLLMYFPESEVREILKKLSEKYPGAHMYFDVVHSYFVGKGITGKFLWGIDKAEDIEKLNENIELVKAWSTGDLNKKRQSLFLRAMNILPATRNRSQILHIRFKPEQGG